MRFHKSLIATLGLAALSTSCGNFSLNEMLVSKAQENSIDQLVQEAQYEYDKGRYDNALSLTDRALAINPNSESPTILKSYVFLSKAGLDGINISKKLIDANDKTATTATTTTATTATAKTGDTTTDNFNTLKAVLNLSSNDYEAMGDPTTIGSESLTIYYPKLASEARAGASDTLIYLNQAVSLLCPLIDSNANPDDDKDTRHTCNKNPFASAAKGRSNFAWALAHLGEAITFYSTILYSTQASGTPNIEAAIPKTQLTPANAAAFITTINKLNSAINAIFPADPVKAANSMLNALFADLETASTALSAIPGIPAEIGDSVKKSIDDLNTKIAAITASGAAASGASAQNEALKNSLTTGISTTLASKIESPEFNSLSTGDQSKACCVYRNLNSTATKPSNCSQTTYNDTSCAALLAQ